MLEVGVVVLLPAIALLYPPSERSELARYHVMLYFPSVRL